MENIHILELERFLEENTNVFWIDGLKIGQFGYFFEGDKETYSIKVYSINKIKKICTFDIFDMYVSRMYPCNDLFIRIECILRNRLCEVMYELCPTIPKYILDDSDARARLAWYFTEFMCKSFTTVGNLIKNIEGFVVLDTLVYCSEVGIVDMNIENATKNKFINAYIEVREPEKFIEDDIESRISLCYEQLLTLVKFQIHYMYKSCDMSIFNHIEHSYSDGKIYINFSRRPPVIKAETFKPRLGRYCKPEPTPIPTISLKELHDMVNINPNIVTVTGIYDRTVEMDKHPIVEIITEEKQGVYRRTRFFQITPSTDTDLYESLIDIIDSRIEGSFRKFLSFRYFEPLKKSREYNDSIKHPEEYSLIMKHVATSTMLNKAILIDGYFSSIPHLSISQMKVDFKYYGQRTGRYFDYIKVTIPLVVGYGCTREQMMKTLNDNIHEIDSFVVKSVENCTKFKNLMLSMGYFELVERVVTHDSLLQYTFEVKRSIEELLFPR